MSLFLTIQSDLYILYPAEGNCPEEANIHTSNVIIGAVKGEIGLQFFVFITTQFPILLHRKMINGEIFFIGCIILNINCSGGRERCEVKPSKIGQVGEGCLLEAGQDAGEAFDLIHRNGL